jgi:signal recognition particle GTPase
VLGSLKPGQALVGIVNRELAATMGEGISDINLAAQPPAVILMAGLQGAGKTTTTAKLAKHLIEKRKKKVLTVSGDVYRPGRHRAAQDRHQAGRRRVVPEHARPEAGGHRARRARPRASATTSTCCWSTRPAAWPSTKR